MHVVVSSARLILLGIIQNIDLFILPFDNYGIKEYLQDQVSYFQERLSKYEDLDVSIDKPTSRMIARHTSNRKSPKKLNSFIEPAAFFARPHRMSLLVGV